MRRATPSSTRKFTNIIISIHALLAESDPSKLAKTSRTEKISIHALLAESDGRARRPGQNCQHFYPRSPCGERLDRWLAGLKGTLFLSTLSLRRATTNHDQGASNQQISIHALLAESDTNHDQGASNQQISIHALLAESDSCTAETDITLIGISIHALLAESDTLRQLQSALCGYFYPRSPCGERRQVKQTYREKISISIHALLAESD